MEYSGEYQHRWERPDDEAAPPPPPPSLLDSLLDAGVSAKVEVGNRVQRFLDDPTFAGSLMRWLATFDFNAPDLARRLCQKLSRDIAEIDERLDRQVNAILHHADFQRLEASWRGLRYLVENNPDKSSSDEIKSIRIRVLNVTLPELLKDAERASDFDQSALFNKVYTEEFDRPGGEPYGVLLGDYEFKNQLNHLLVLEKLAQVAAAAFSPFIAAAHPHLLDIRAFAELQHPSAVEAIGRDMDNKDHPPYLKWRRFRESEDSRFVGLTLPRVLMREPYRSDNNRPDGFHFREKTGKPDGSEMLWGNAAYAYGAVLMRAFGESGWLADIRGMRRGEAGGGVTQNLPRAWFDTDQRGLIPRPATEVIITDAQERVLGDLGFLPLSWCQDTAEAAFHGCQSVQKPKSYTKIEATVNARMSSMLQYLFCVSRFAHYIKAMVRDMVGSALSHEDIQFRLNTWLNLYTNGSTGMGPSELARHPLRAGWVEVHEVPGSAGHYRCHIYLQPQYQLDNLVGQIRLETR